MYEHAGNSAFEIDKLTGWFNWMGRHPGLVLLGALAMAIVAVQESTEAEPTEHASSEEEVPLFI